MDIHNLTMNIKHKNEKKRLGFGFSDDAGVGRKTCGSG